MRQIQEIVVHCTATVEGKDYTVPQIREWHKQRGFTDIGYHFVVHLDGRVSKGRPVEQAGAHVAGRNANTIGITYVGGLAKDMSPKDTRTAAQKAAMLKLLRELLDRFPSVARISGHNQYANKACPCFNAKTEYAHMVRPGKPMSLLPESYVIKTRGVATQDGEGVDKGTIVSTTGNREGDWVETNAGLIHESQLDQTEVAKPALESRKVKGGLTATLGSIGTIAAEQAGKLQPLAEASNYLKYAFIALTVVGVLWALYAAFDDRTPGRVSDDA